MVAYLFAEILAYFFETKKFAEFWLIGQIAQSYNRIEFIKKQLFLHQSWL
jgi:hypothetical protein